MEQIYNKSKLLMIGMFWQVLFSGYHSVRISSVPAPVCHPPLSTEVDCSTLPPDFNPQDETQMTELFGTATCGSACDGLFVEELEANEENLNDCGTGRLVRRFGIKDAVGEELARCQQLIRIYPFHDYWLKFPADVKLENTLQKADTILTSEGTCDLLAVAGHDVLENCPAAYCRRVMRTYSVINWCEYDGVSPPVIVGRDEDGNGQPGDSALFVVVKTKNRADPCRDFFRDDQDFHYQHVWYAPNSDPSKAVGAGGNTYANSVAQPDFWREIYPSAITGMEGPIPANNCKEMASVGYWQYTQIIELGYASEVWQGHPLVYPGTGKEKIDLLADPVKDEYAIEKEPYSAFQKTENHRFELYQNSPNPFTGQTVISFYLPEPAEVLLRVCDASGKVRELIRAKYEKGRNQIVLQCQDWRETGVLYYTLTAGNNIAGRKMILKN